MLLTARFMVFVKAAAFWWTIFETSSIYFYISKEDRWSIYVDVHVLVHCGFIGSTIQKGQSNTYRNIDKKAFDDSVRSGQKNESDYIWAPCLHAQRYRGFGSNTTKRKKKEKKGQ